MSIDLRFGARMLLKRPVFTIVAVITLALGIGANTAIFSVINAILLRPLPGYQTDRLVIIRLKTLESDSDNPGQETFRAWRQRAHSFEQIEAGAFQPYSVAGDPPRSEQAALITTGYFSLYRVHAILGRLFLPDEDSREHVAVLDYEYWQRRFGGDPKIVDQTIKLNKEDFVIVGVTPADFHPLGRGRVPFYLPLVLDKNNDIGIWVVARLKRGLSFEQAKAEMAGISRQLEIEDPQNYRGVEANPVPILETWVAQIRLVLRLLFAAVTVVLLIACANVANLLLASGAARRQEFTIRLALGASRWRLARQMIVESLLLTFSGGVLGLLLAAWIISALRKLGWLYIPRIDEVNLDPTVLGFVLLSVLITGLLCSLVPALLLTRQDVNLSASSRSFTGIRAQKRTRHVLIVSEIALTFVLLYTAGLVTQNLVRMQHMDLGYDPHHVLTFALTLPVTNDRSGLQFVASYDRIRERIQRLSGVEQAGLTICLPTGEGAGPNMDVKIEGRPAPPHNGEANAILRIVSGDYFRALRIPLLQGRLFDERDSFGRANTVIITKSVANRFFPHQNPLGQRLMIDWIDPNMRAGDDTLIPREIVGMVGDVRQTLGTDGRRMELLLSYGQNGVRSMMMAVRTTGDPMKLIPAIRRAVAEEERDLPIADVKTMEERISVLTIQSRTNTMLFGSFAALALLLSAIGLYGVMSYTITQRTREIGIRTALGAQTGDVLGLVVRQGIKLILTGVIIGLAATFAMRRLTASLVYDTRAIDPVTLVAITVLLTGVAIVACWLPARRAAQVDPLIVLRCE